MGWGEQRHSPELIEQVRKLWIEGHTTPVIAARVGMSGKNAVIGLVQRARERDGEDKWPARAVGRRNAGRKPRDRGPRPSRMVPQPQKRALPTPPAVVVERVVPKSIVPKRVRFIDRNPLKECAYPLDDNLGPEMICCGLPVDPGFSWCPYHLDRVAVSPRRRRAA